MFIVMPNTGKGIISNILYSLFFSLPYSSRPWRSWRLNPPGIVPDKSLANRQISPYSYAMVKKLFLSVFTFLLLAAFTGVPVILHFCGMTGVSAKACTMCTTAAVEEPVEEESTDSCCEAEQQEPEQSPHSFVADMSCCHSDIISAPIKIDQELTSLNVIKKAPVQADLDFFADIPTSQTESVSLQTLLVDRAPPITQPPIRIITSSFLI